LSLVGPLGNSERDASRICTPPDLIQEIANSSVALSHDANLLSGLNHVDRHFGANERLACARRTLYREAPAVEQLNEAPRCISRGLVGVSDWTRGVRPQPWWPAKENVTCRSRVSLGIDATCDYPLRQPAQGFLLFPFVEFNGRD
jgi:hypothetical protein